MTEEEGEKESVCKGDAESKGSADKRKHMATHLWAKVHEVQGKKVTTVLHSGPTRFCIEEGSQVLYLGDLEGQGYKVTKVSHCRVARFYTEEIRVARFYTEEIRRARVIKLQKFHPAG
ncbi:hypothetical protein RRG08_016049 [Elysia crispata]|uniref:Uncharacterized protein n=1 Tax=Elysia crispata TaxID=231223 RepID=A0AAE1DJ79_9GAST|nr:hypothetical protein RRG08_016049 [Elysia crispata]